jgi:hypothetical protein
MPGSDQPSSDIRTIRKCQLFAELATRGSAFLRSIATGTDIDCGSRATSKPSPTQRVALGPPSPAVREGVLSAAKGVRVVRPKRFSLSVVRALGSLVVSPALRERGRVLGGQPQSAPLPQCGRGAERSEAGEGLGRADFLAAWCGRAARWSSLPHCAAAGERESQNPPRPRGDLGRGCACPQLARA